MISKVLTPFKNILEKIKGGEPNYQEYFRKADEAIDNQKYDKAEKYFEKIVIPLERISSLSSIQRKYIGRAYLGLGKVLELKNDPLAATENYVKAMKASVAVQDLQDSAVLLLGKSFLNNNDKTHMAVEIYLRVLKLRPKDKITGKICTILEPLCVIDEKQETESRRKAMALNERGLASDSEIAWANFYLGIGSYLENNTTKAKEYLTRAVELDPQRVLSKYWLGKTYWALRQIESAASYFLKFIDGVPSDQETIKQAEAYFYIGRSLVEQLGGISKGIDLSVQENINTLRKAITYFEKALIKNEGRAEYFFSIARVRALLGEHEQSIVALQKAVAIAPAKSEYLFYLALELKMTGRFDEAVEIIDKALTLKEKDVYRLLLAKLYVLTNNFQAAEAQCLKLLDTKGDADIEAGCVLISALYHQAKYEEIIQVAEVLNKDYEISRRSGDATFCIARAFSQTGKYTEAVSWYETLLDKKDRPDAWYYLACALANSEHYDDALMVFNEYVRDGRYKVLADLQCGNILTKTGRDKEALENYEKAYSRDPENIDILCALGSFYYNAGNNQEALKYFSNVLTRDPGNRLAHFCTGLMYEKQGNISQAIKEYDLASSQVENLSKAHLRLGVLYCRNGEYQKALNYLREVYETGNRSDTVLYYVGLAGLFNKQYGLALNTWEELANRDHGDSILKSNVQKVYYLMGSVCVKENKISEAVLMWEKYLEGYPDDAKTKQDLAELYFRCCIAELYGGDINRAKHLIQRALDIAPSDTNYLYYSGLCNFRLSLFPECIEQFGHLLQTNPDSARIKYHLGLSLLRTGEKEKAMQVLGELAVKEERDIYAEQASWLIANEYIKEGQYEEALPLLGVYR